MSSSLERPSPARQRAIITGLQTQDSQTHVYAVSKTWYQKWLKYVGGAEKQKRSKSRSNEPSPESTAENTDHYEAQRLMPKDILSDIVSSHEVSKDSGGSNPAKSRYHPVESACGGGISVSADYSEWAAEPVTSTADPCSGDPGPLTMDSDTTSSNMWVDEAVWLQWVSWYGVSSEHQLDRRNWASEERQYEVCVLSPYAGIVSNPVKTLDNNDTAGWVEMQLRRMFQIADHTSTRLWACEKQRTSRFRPLLDRSRELCFLLHSDKTYILALELANHDNTWPTKLPGKPSPDLQVFHHLTAPASKNYAAWENELSTAIETVFLSITGEMQDTVQGVVTTARCVTDLREKEIEKARRELRSRLTGIDLLKTTLEAKTKQLTKQEEQVKTEAQALSKERVSLEAERNRLAQEMLALEAMNRKTETRVKLDIGGCLYTTSTLTLSREPDSMLAAMFSGRHELVTEDDGAYFIDRDGTHFRYILNYLRDGGFKAGTLPTDTVLLCEILAEAEYYQISGLQKILNDAIEAGTQYEEQVMPEKLPSESPGRRVIRKILHKK